MPRPDRNRLPRRGILRIAAFSHATAKPGWVRVSTAGGRSAPRPQKTDRGKCSKCGPPKMRLQERLGCGVGWEMARVPWESTDCRAWTVTVCHVAGFYGLPRFSHATAGSGLGRGVGWEMARVPRESTDCRARTVTVCHVAGFYGLPRFRMPQPSQGVCGCPPRGAGAHPGPSRRTEENVPSAARRRRAARRDSAVESAGKWLGSRGNLRIAAPGP